MNRIKKFKVFKSEEDIDQGLIPWEKFENFIFNVQDTFSEIMDDVF